MLTLIKASGETLNELISRKSYTAYLELTQNTSAPAADDFFCKGPKKRLKQPESCIRPSKQPTKILLWGDSNAAHYIGMLGMLSQNYDFTFDIKTKVGCPPLFADVSKYASSNREGCASFVRSAEQFIEGYDFIIIGGQWYTYFSVDTFKTDFEHTLSELSKRGKKLIVLAQIPFLHGYDRYCDAKKLIYNFSDESCKTLLTRNARLDLKGNAYLKNLADKGAFVFFDVRPLLCEGKRCSPYLVETSGYNYPVYYNKSHLSLEGSWALGKALLGHKNLIPEIFSELGQPKNQAL